MNSTCTCIWTRFIMSSKDSYLYVLDYWVPFPASEYGGLITLIAENDQEAFDILSNEEQLESDYGHLIMEQIVKSTKLKLAEEHESGIIDVFCTWWSNQIVMNCIRLRKNVHPDGKSSRPISQRKNVRNNMRHWLVMEYHRTESKSPDFNDWPTIRFYSWTT